MVSAVLCIILGVIVWPVLKKVLEMPSYQQIEQTNMDLKYWEKLFETFMEHSPAVAFLLDNDYNLLYVNKAYEELFGVDRTALIGKPHSPWASAEVADQIGEQNKRVMREGKPLTKVLWTRRGQNGEPEPWLTIKFPVFGNHHNAAIGGFAINVASTHKMEQAHAQLAAIVESSQDAIIGKDLNGIITSWNPGAEELYGYTAEEAIGQQIQFLAPPDRKDEVPQLLDKIRRGIRVGHFETVRLCKNGKLKNVSLSLSPIRADGNIIGGALIARDIDHQKVQEQYITELNKQLNDRVYELAEQTAALQAARDQALEASNLKSAFVANISHEIRTPLSGILGLNEMVLQNGNLNGEDFSWRKWFRKALKRC